MWAEPSYGKQYTDDSDTEVRRIGTQMMSEQSYDQPAKPVMINVGQFEDS